MSHPGHRTEVCQCGEVIQYGTEPRVQVCITCPKCENAVASVVVDGDTARVQDVSFTIPSGLMRDVMVALLLARAETAEAGLAEYKAECARWKAENAGMRGVLESFIGTAEAAIHHQETKNKGGQQVPFFGDFHESTPSTAARLRWWKKRMEKALEGPSPEPPQRNGCTRLSTEKGVDVCRNCGGKRSEHPLARVP